MKFEIKPEDIKHVAFFEPQKAAIQLTLIMQRKVAEVMGYEMACDHVAELKKLPGLITDAASQMQFGEPYRYVCTLCGKVLEPTGFR